MIYKYKGYDIKPHKEFPTSYIVVTEGKGGKIPKVLDGLFTSTGLAKDRIDKYLEVKQSAETISKG
jgi:hypothetical protein